MVATRVLPSPVFISAIMPWWRTIPPINWTSKGRISTDRFAASRTTAKAGPRLFDELDLDPELIDRDRSVPLEGLGGFLALESPRAGDIHRGLKSEGVSTDFRGHILRLGPAPYLSDRQLETAMDLLGRVVEGLS